MQKRKIVSVMMSAVIAIGNLSSIATPVYAKSNFIFPTVSTSAKTGSEIEKVEEKMPVEAVNEKSQHETVAKDIKKKDVFSEITSKLVVDENNSQKEELDVSACDDDSLVEVDSEESASGEANEVEDFTEEEVLSKEIVIENKAEQVALSSETDDSVILTEAENSRLDLELNHNICQIQHINGDDCSIYDYPSVENGVELECLPNKTSVFIIGDSINEFYSVSYNDEVYYVKKDNTVKISSQDFEEIDPRIVYLNQKTNLLNFDENKSSAFLAEDLVINTQLEVVGKHELGYVKVLFDEGMGYIAEEYCSDTRIIPKTSEIQLEIARKASDPETAPCEFGYCAAWVTRIYKAAGLYGDKAMGNAIDFWTRWGINDGVTSSTRYDNIPVGAVVIGSGSGGDLGNTYGHVGIYLGDGMVAENIGKHSVVALERWMEKNVGICDGYQGYIGWVFPFNIDLQEYSVDKRESLEQKESNNKTEVETIEDMELKDIEIAKEEDSVELTEQAD